LNSSRGGAGLRAARRLWPVPSANRAATDTCRRPTRPNRSRGTAVSADDPGRGPARPRDLHHAQGGHRRAADGRTVHPDGSANVLLVPRLADSLAGRMGILRLHPLAPCELHGKRPRFIETLFRGGFPTRVTHRLWALSMEAVAAGLMAMVFSSYVMGFRLKPKRRWGVIALLLGIVVCGVFLSPALTWVL
jgi:hypothetical protein